MENEFLAVLSTCPWVQNARLLKKPEQPETVATILNDMISFNLKEGNDVSDIQPLIVGYLDKLGFTKNRQDITFEAHGDITALLAGMFTDGNLKIRVAISWLEQEERLVVIHTTQFV
jgi:hypothetical protein